VGPPDGLRAGKARPLGWKQLRRKEPGSKRVCVWRLQLTSTLDLSTSIEETVIPREAELATHALASGLPTIPSRKASAHTPTGAPGRLSLIPRPPGGLRRREAGGSLARRERRPRGPLYPYFGLKTY